MRLNDKLAAVKREVDFVAQHDDANVDEVREAIKNIRAIVDAAEARLVKRRLGNPIQRVSRYFTRLISALLGK